MARKPSGWKPKGKRDREAVVVSAGVAVVVPVRGGTAVRILTTPKQALAAGFGAALAKAMFKRPGNRKDDPKEACKGECSVAFSDDNLWVWCKSITCELESICECRLREMWKDKDGPHDEDRGAPGPDMKYRRKEGRGYRCICKPIARTDPVPDPGPDNPT